MNDATVNHGLLKSDLPASINEAIERKQFQDRILNNLLAFSLYDKQQQCAELVLVLEAAIRERHHYWHTERWGADWRKCGNNVCIEARPLIERARQPQVSMNPLSAQLMQRYTVRIAAVSGNIIAALVDKQAVANEELNQQPRAVMNPRLVIAE